VSTRANIIIKDQYDEQLFFYRHSDGYPEGTMPTLEKFLSYVKEGRIRDNIRQAAGWLILIGADEYTDKGKNALEPTSKGYSGWKCGAYEPTTGIHCDVEYIYTIDLDTKTILVEDN